LFIEYNSCTPCGISCIEYLSVDIHIHVYTIIHSGAYYGFTVGTVEGLVAVDHRDSMVDKYWQHPFFTVKSSEKQSIEQGRLYN